MHNPIENLTPVDSVVASKDINSKYLNIQKVDSFSINASKLYMDRQIHINSQLLCAK